MNIDDLAAALGIDDAGDVVPFGEPKKTRPPGEKIKVGERDKAFFRAASYLAGLGVSEETIKETLWKTYQTDMEHKDSDQEGEVKTRIAEKARRAIGGAVYDAQTTAQAADNQGTATKPPTPLFEPLATLLQNPHRPDWRVDKLIETPSTVLWFGPSGSGKTFIAADLAGACAINGQWAGRDVKAPGPVFYLAGEGRTGLLRRFRAWQLHHKVTIPPDRLFLSTSRIGLDEVGALKVELAIEELTKESGVSPSLIVVDTLARSLPSGADENSAKDMMAFVNIVDRLRDRFNCVVLIIHHSGIADDKRARGSTSLKAAMDAELSIRKQAGRRIAEWTKLKDLPDEPAPQEFTLETVILSAEEDGEIVTSAVVSWKGKGPVSSGIRVTKAEDLGLKTLRAAIETNSGMPVNIDAWREPFYAEHWGEDDAGKRQAFHRIRQSLAGKNLIRIDKGRYSTASKASDSGA